MIATCTTAELVTHFHARRSAEGWTRQRLIVNITFKKDIRSSDDVRGKGKGGYTVAVKWWLLTIRSSFCCLALLSLPHSPSTNVSKDPYSITSQYTSFVVLVTEGELSILNWCHRLLLWSNIPYVRVRIYSDREMMVSRSAKMSRKG